MSRLTHTCCLLPLFNPLFQVPQWHPWQQQGRGHQRQHPQRRAVSSQPQAGRDSKPQPPLASQPCSPPAYCPGSRAADERHASHLCTLGLTGLSSNPSVACLRAGTAGLPRQGRVATAPLVACARLQRACPPFVLFVCSGAVRQPRRLPAYYPCLVFPATHPGARHSEPGLTDRRHSCTTPSRCCIAPSTPHPVALHFLCSIG